jgi:hypothetical protein
MQESGFPLRPSTERGKRKSCEAARAPGQRAACTRTRQTKLVCARVQSSNAGCAARLSSPAFRSPPPIIMRTIRASYAQLALQT